MAPSPPADAYAQAAEAFAAGRFDAATRLCREAIKREPRHAEALFLLGAIALGAERAEEALVQFRAALEIGPAEPRFLHAAGEALRSLGRSAEASAALRAALERDPTLVAALNSLGLIELEAGDMAGAVREFRAAVAARPTYARSHLNLGRALQMQQNVSGAIASYREALGLEPGYAIAHNNLGAALVGQGDHAGAATALRRALEINPDYPEAHCNLATALLGLDNPAGALACCERAIRLRPDYFKARLQMGMALEELERRPEAMAIYERLVQADPTSGEAWQRLALLLMVSNQWDRARTALEQVARHLPGADRPLAKLVFARQMLCVWSAREENLHTLGDLVDSRLAVGLTGGVVPFYSIVFGWSAARRLRIARAEARLLEERQQSLRQELANSRRKPERGKLRIGYLSGDFYDHAVSHLTQGMFALHDAGRFDIHAYSFGPADGSSYRRRIEADCAHFADVRQMRTAELARRIASDGIDILVDMMGFSGYTRLEVMAARPAPVQVSWLAYPGTTGATWIDFIIGDRFVTPPEAASQVSEQIVRLPHSYLIADREQPVAAAAARRGDHGLPETGFVFACINNGYKDEPEIFAIWMRILAQVPGSVLWLKSGGPTMEANLHREAGARGVIPERILFARGHLPKPEHLARLRLADLFLDTPTYNAHTTAIDALWAGLPVLTCPGPTFPGRVGQSLLEAAELPELIAPDLAAYERLAVGLAHDRAQLAGLRQRLADRRGALPLFDTPRFVRHLEQAFEAIWSIHQAGLSPQAIDISAD